MSNNGAPRPDNHVIVLFGATGDLAKRKLLPGLFHLHAAGLLPKEYRIIGASPAQYALTDAQFREHAEQACSDPDTCSVTYVSGQLHQLGINATLQARF